MPGAPEVVAERFGADLSTAVPSTLDAARAAEPEYQVPLPTVLLVGDLGEGWSLAVEINGFQGTRPEVLRALTAGGETAYAAYWNINLDSRVVLAESGRVVGAIEPFDGDDMWGAAPERLSRHFEGLPLGRPSDDLLQVPDTDIKAAALLAGERATGRGVDAGWLDRRHVRYLITDGLAPDGPALNELADHPLVRADPGWARSSPTRSPLACRRCWTSTSPRSSTTASWMTRTWPGLGRWSPTVPPATRRTRPSSGSKRCTTVSREAGSPHVRAEAATKDPARRPNTGFRDVTRCER
ncbi:DUF6461 domain-containing protein [Actinomadura yumaensis]|uniref:DUF6461 domain-containing protein n=1 Tax=Actinomadura yumaensis TaxID=111807 RepID=UPI00361819CB